MFKWLLFLYNYTCISLPQVLKKEKGMVLDIAPLNDAQWHFTTLEVAADWHCL